MSSVCTELHLVLTLLCSPSLSRKESLRLLRKMCHYISADCLSELCNEAPLSDQQQPHPPFSVQISELLAVVLENEEDIDGQLVALHILQDLMNKYSPAFDEQFVRLGLPNKIALLAGAAEDDEEEEEGQKDTDKKDTPTASSTSEGAGGSEEKPSQEVPPAAKTLDMELEDATEIAAHSPYQWRDWSMVRSRDCIYLWNDYCAIELSNVSNGWFRFLVDNKLATMYSSGSTEGGPGSFGTYVRHCMSVHTHSLICTCTNKHPPSTSKYPYNRTAHTHLLAYTHTTNMNPHPSKYFHTVTQSHRRIHSLTHTENRVEFLEKLQRGCSQIGAGVSVCPILSLPSPLRLVVGNWSLMSQREGEVVIHNVEGNKVGLSLSVCVLAVG